MTTLNLYGGALKRDLIKRAYGLCGQSVTEYELTPEELDLGIQSADALAAMFGASFPWNYGVGSSDEESGLDAADGLGFTAMLAQEIAPNIGKDFRPNGTQARAVSVLRAKYQPVPFMEMSRQTPRGAGNRFWRQAPYFYAPTSGDEPAQ